MPLLLLKPWGGGGGDNGSSPSPLSNYDRLGGPQQRGEDERGCKWERRAQAGGKKGGRGGVREKAVVRPHPDMVIPNLAVSANG